MNDKLMNLINKNPEIEKYISNLENLINELVIKEVFEKMLYGEIDERWKIV